MLPLIANHGFFEDIIFKLVATTTRNGVALGNFIYDDDKHWIKITCVINNNELKTLEEGYGYFITFKNVKYQEDFIVADDFSKIHYPVVCATLISAKSRYN